MWKAITQYRATGERGGYTLQWQGPNCPTYVIGKNNTVCWYKFKKDAVSRAAELNKCLLNKPK